MDDSRNSGDHDLLIEVKTTLMLLVKEFQMMRSDTTKRLDAVEKDKLDKVTFEAYRIGHEKYDAERISDLHDFINDNKVNINNNKKALDRLTVLIATGMGIIGALQFIAPYLINNLF